MKHPKAACGCGEEPDLDRHISPAAEQPAQHIDKLGAALLFTTPTCPNCRLAVTMLDKQASPMRSSTPRTTPSSR